MCGITGFSGEGNHRILEAMNQAIAYRGPDSAGMYCEEGIGLAHRRLAIVDLSPAGHQPMTNEGRSIWLVFNGEIYNFAKLRASLKDAHVFKGHSDTEVIIHLYEELGLDVFSKLEGMFALALYDTRTKKLVLARDRLGKKSLYWSQSNGTFVFGSELKALLAHPGVPRSLNIDALGDYLQREYIATPQSIFNDIQKLLPGHYLVYDGTTVTLSPFWDIAFKPTFSGDFKAGIKALDLVLDEAVSERLMGDVSLGVFLSGGIDSSAIASYAVKHSPKIKTFSIGFAEASFDESQYAREVAALLGTSHHEYILTGADSLKIIPELYQKLDEPLADHSLIPTYLLSKFTRAEVTVALGGDGGDELLCGYDPFVAHRLAKLYGVVPGFVRGAIRAGVSRLPTSFSNISLDFKLKKFVSDFEGDPAERNRRWLGAFGKSDLGSLLVPELFNLITPEPSFAELELAARQQKEGRDYYHDLIHEYLRTYLLDDILVKVDRASMYNSLEVRAPFLARSVVELVNQMPTNWKFRGLTRKYILKKLMESRLPKHIIHRPKKGFGIPLAHWLRHELTPLVDELLNPAFLKQQGIFNVEYVNRLLAEHRAQTRDNRKLLWTLLVFQMWWREYLR